MDDGDAVEIVNWSWSDYALPALALVCSAWAIWLMVRIINRRERWAMWMLASELVAVFAVYPLCIGPASRLSFDPDCPHWIRSEFPAFFEPVLRVLEAAPEAVSDVASEYIELWHPADNHLRLNSRQAQLRRNSRRAEISP
jgi:hypothetical protein